MTDPDVPDFDDPSYDALRGLLAGARSDDPVPADVAARLDATLAELTAGRASDTRRSSPVETTESGTTADVLPLRKRSRLAPRLLVAAAAIVVVGAGGVGIAHVLDDSSNATVTAADSAAGSLTETPGPTVPPTSTSGRVPEPVPATENLSSPVLPAFSTSDFAADAKRYSVTQRLLGRSANELKSLDLDDRGGGYSAAVPRPGAPSVNGAGPGRTTEQGSGSGGSSAGKSGSSPTSGSAADGTCAGPVGTDAVIAPIVLDGSPAALAVHPVKDGQQLVEAWSCDGRTVLVATSVAR